MSRKYAKVLKSLEPFLQNQNQYNEFGKKVSNAQRYKRKNTLTQGVKALRDSDYRLDDVTLFKGRHFNWLFNQWIEAGLSASAIQYRSSVFRLFANQWLNKAGMIQPTTHYCQTQSQEKQVKRTAVATISKCWSDNQVNPFQMIQQIEAYDKRVAVQLKLQLMFKLRKKESFLLKPHESDLESILFISRGTKGGRERVVMVDTLEKREALDLAKAITPRQCDSMITADKTLKQWENHYSYVLNKFNITKKELGITSHGLRHEAANNEYEKLTGNKASVRGGSIGIEHKDIDELARDRISQELGHARRSITSAYVGVQKLTKS